VLLTFLFEDGFILPNGNVNGNERSNRIFICVKQNPDFTLDQISEYTGLPKRTVSREMKVLQDTGMIKRIGSPKTGHWEVIE